MARSKLRLPALPALGALGPVPTDLPDEPPVDDDVALASSLAQALDDADPTTRAATLADLFGISVGDASRLGEGGSLRFEGDDPPIVDNGDHDSETS